ncbi:ABC transporter ATP-binding protein [Abyssibius alkaniclasticus]|uniref:ABC transporter ATP-binding protein n=1 Tax=Abyssibius alkaniclasticus TaxID=2881234 RepID=UPI0023648885|nr:ABC transporter ATP-binding protein [Abyssibius alkaniclasticus]UPH71438.1 ABC transporter ATP-binding protein [Abyssibius alkaniclasticus]|tara:strand:+ start:207 stop:1139 length:933 start_codon:yes stop_codon:yes gene_type:complete
MSTIVSIKNLSKTYGNGHTALDNVSLDIKKGEILALLGPNGAGKTTLISIICGLVKASQGTVEVGGYDTVRNFRKCREQIALVPQELTVESYEPVVTTMRFSRRLFGKPANPALLEDILKKLSLSDKRDARIMTLSGGMKRRVMIAKALSHEPTVLFLDEPTAGVDVELRKDMWNMVRELRDNGVTVILTTHYIEEAEEMADRIGVIDKGRLVLVEEKTELMKRLGKKELHVELAAPAPNPLPESLTEFALSLDESRQNLTYSYDTNARRTGIARLLSALSDCGMALRDVATRQSSLEEIFVALVKGEQA